MLNGPSSLKLCPLFADTYVRDNGPPRFLAKAEEGVKENNRGELGSHFAVRCKMGTQLNTAGGLCLFFAHPTGTESVRIYY